MMIVMTATDHQPVQRNKAVATERPRAGCLLAQVRGGGGGGRDEHDEDGLDDGLTQLAKNRRHQNLMEVPPP